MSTIVRETQDTERERRARTLEAAALEIEVRGWVQGIRFSERDGSVCAVGAISCVLFGDPFFDAMLAYGEASRLMGTGDDADMVLSAFNDNVQSANEVTFLLRWRAEEIRDGR